MAADGAIGSDVEAGGLMSSDVSRGPLPVPGAIESDVEAGDSGSSDISRGPQPVPRGTATAEPGAPSRAPGCDRRLARAAAGASGHGHGGTGRPFQGHRRERRARMAADGAIESDVEAGGLLSSDVSRGPLPVPRGTATAEPGASFEGTDRNGGPGWPPRARSSRTSRPGAPGPPTSRGGAGRPLRGHRQERRARTAAEGAKDLAVGWHVFQEVAGKIEAYLEDEAARLQEGPPPP